MRNEELARLVWGQVDSELSAPEQSSLERWLEDDPGARRQALEIEQLARLLDPPGEVEPPPSLRPRIDRALVSVRTPWAQQAPVVRPTPTWQWSQRLAYLVAGVVLGVVVTLLVLPGGQTGISSDRAAATMGAAAPEQRLELVLGEDAGRLELERRGNVVSIDLVMVTADELELGIQAKGGGFRLEGVTHGGGESGEVRLLGSRLVARLAGIGEHRLSLRLDDPQVSLQVRALRRGRLLAEGGIGAITGAAP